MAKQRRTITLDDRVCEKAEDLVLPYKAAGMPMTFSSMINWLVSRQMGLVGDMEPMEDKETTNEE